MKYFDTYVSNSVAGSANQHWFSAPRAQTGRIFYRITCGGRYAYSLLFSNIIDSTYADGSRSHKNLVCDEWHLCSARIGRLPAGGIPGDFTDPGVAEAINAAVIDPVPLTFDGSPSKTVAPGEFFTSDPLEAEFSAGDYLCLETTVSGQMIPYHEETQLPSFLLTEDGWRYGRTTPVAGMIGCNRPVQARVCYLGDSITQGIGVARNSYRHWNALLSERLGDRFAFWNLGIGYGRADDIGSDGAWLFKARQNDAVILCAGVNDLGRGFSAEQIIASLEHTVDLLLSRNITVVLQTVPPFDYNEERTLLWNRVNDYIRTVLQKKVALVFDAAELLGCPQAPQRARYGGHPNEEGCALWADRLYAALTESHCLEE